MNNNYQSVATDSPTEPEPLLYGRGETGLGLLAMLVIGAFIGFAVGSMWGHSLL